MKKYEKIRMAIESYCASDNFYHWCEAWGFSISDFTAYLDTADKNAPEKLKEDIGDE